MTLIIDIGNTNTKFAFFNNDKLFKVYVVPTTNAITVKTLPKNINVKYAYIGSVVPAMNKIIIKLVHAHYQVKPTLIKQVDFSRLLDLKQFNLSEIGMDLLALSLFIKTRYKFGVGISFGTATFAICVKNNKMYGAIIAPSVETGIKNLHNKTALINSNSITGLNTDFGTNTKTALHAGAFHMANGFVNSVLAHANKKYHINHAYVTGGKLKSVKVKYDKNIHFVDYAVIWGYYYLTKTLS